MWAAAPSGKIQQHNINSNIAASMTTQGELEDRARGVFAQEVPAADALYQGMQSGEYSPAAARQRAGLGQAIGATNMAAAGSNPMAARAAMYGGGEQASQFLGQAAEQRQGEVLGAQQAAYAARLRQMQYEAAIRQMREQQASGWSRVKQGLDVTALQQQQYQQALQKQLMGGVMGAIGSTAAYMGSLPSEGGGGPMPAGADAAYNDFNVAGGSGFDKESW